jgi:hypothetical protein
MVILCFFVLFIFHPVADHFSSGGGEGGISIKADLPISDYATTGELCKTSDGTVKIKS